MINLFYKNMFSSLTNETQEYRFNFILGETEGIKGVTFSYNDHINNKSLEYTCLVEQIYEKFPKFLEELHKLYK